MSADNQKSPKTLAKDVAISANTTSENSIGEWEEGRTHRPSALQTSERKSLGMMRTYFRNFSRSYLRGTLIGQTRNMIITRIVTRGI